MARYSNTLTAQDFYRNGVLFPGPPIGGALVLVDDALTGASAALTDDNGYPIDNPLITNADGTYYFNTTDGNYNLTFRHGGRVIGELLGVGIGAPTGLLPGQIVAALGGSSLLAIAQSTVTNALASTFNARLYAKGVDIGSGVSTLLSSRYLSVAAAQVDFPFVTELGWEFDAAALQAAIYAAPAGSKIVVPAPKGGFYRFNRPIVIPNGQTLVEFQGSESTLINRYGDYGPTFYIGSTFGLLSYAGIKGARLADPNSNMTLQNSPFHVVFEGVSHGAMVDVQMVSGTGLLAILSCDQFWCPEIDCHAFAGTPTEVGTDSVTRYRHMIFVGASLNGPGSTNPRPGYPANPSDIFLDQINNKMRNGASFNAYSGLYVETVDGLWGTDLHSEGSTYTDIFLNRTGPAPLANVYIENVMADICQTNGIVLNGATVAGIPYPVGRTRINGQLSGNLNGGPTGTGLLVTGAGAQNLEANVSVEGFNLHGVQIDPNATSTQDVSLRLGPVVRGGGLGNGVSIEAGSNISVDVSMIDGLKDDGTSGGYNFGVFVGPAASNVTIKAPNVTRSASDGIIINGAQHVNIVGGQSFNNVGYGLRVTGAADYVTVLGLDLTGNTSGDQINNSTGTHNSINVVNLANYLHVAQFGAYGIGDDTAAIQRAMNAAGSKQLHFGPYHFVSATLVAPPNATLVGSATTDGSLIYRTGDYGDTIVCGSTSNPALAFSCENLWFKHNALYASGALPGGKATQGAHIRLYGAQNCDIENNYFWRLPYNVIFHGGSILSLRGNTFIQTWDHADVAAQEGTSSVFLDPSTSYGNPKDVFLTENEFLGTKSASRSVTYSDAYSHSKTLSMVENIGPRWAVLVNGCETMTSIGNYYGCSNEANIFLNPTSPGLIANVRMSADFQDGARNWHILAQKQNGAQPIINFTIDCVQINGELNSLHGLGVISAPDGTPSVYTLQVDGLTCNATIGSPMTISGAVSYRISSPVLTNWNCLGVAPNVGPYDAQYASAGYLSGPDGASYFGSVDGGIIGGGGNYYDQGSSNYCWQGFYRDAPRVRIGPMMFAGVNGFTGMSQGEPLFITANYSATGFENTIFSFPSAPQTITLPTTAPNGTRLVIKDIGDASTNPITISGLIDGVSGSKVINTAKGFLRLESLGNNGWFIN